MMWALTFYLLQIERFRSLFNKKVTLWMKFKDQLKARTLTRYKRNAICQLPKRKWGATRTLLKLKWVATYLTQCRQITKLQQLLTQKHMTTTQAWRKTHESARSRPSCSRSTWKRAACVFRSKLSSPRSFRNRSLKTKSSLTQPCVCAKSGKNWKP